MPAIRQWFTFSHNFSITDVRGATFLLLYRIGLLPKSQVFWREFLAAMAMDMSSRRWRDWCCSSSSSQLHVDKSYIFATLTHNIRLSLALNAIFASLWVGLLHFRWIKIDSIYSSTSSTKGSTYETQIYMLLYQQRVHRIARLFFIDSAGKLRAVIGEELRIASKNCCKIGGQLGAVEEPSSKMGNSFFSSSIWKSTIRWEGKISKTSNKFGKKRKTYDKALPFFGPQAWDSLVMIVPHRLGR